MHTFEITNHDITNNEKLTIQATGTNDFSNELKLKAAITLIESLSEPDYDSQEEYDAFIKLCSDLKQATRYL
ncbi:hypothetical protein [Companilactobacillus sp. HBUAS59699]|uniref:hypothetical protein n=1 Tax=Companilactobacillus sp. HBUAS59699 TaxID=3109358 RepID=UPI002FF2AABB